MIQKERGKKYEKRTFKDFERVHKKTCLYSRKKSVVIAKISLLSVFVQFNFSL
jgi:hypothetical protein